MGRALAVRRFETHPCYSCAGHTTHRPRPDVLLSASACRETDLNQVASSSQVVDVPVGTCGEERWSPCLLTPRPARPPRPSMRGVVFLRRETSQAHNGCFSRCRAQAERPHRCSGKRDQWLPILRGPGNGVSPRNGDQEMDRVHLRLSVPAMRMSDSGRCLRMEGLRRGVPGHAGDDRRLRDEERPTLVGRSG